jgi:hypothetical protein
MVQLLQARDDLSNSSGSCRRGNSGGSGSISITVYLSLSAITGDVAGLAAAVAGLARSVQRSSVGGSAVTGDVSQLAASIALHGLSLAIASEMVRSTALVASGRARTASVASPEATTEATTSGTSSTAHTSSRVGAVASQMSSKTAAIAATAGSTSAQTKSRAIGLDVPKSLAVIALLRLSSARMRASVRFVSRLLAVIAKPLGRRAHLGVVPDISALKARSARERRHF